MPGSRRSRAATVSMWIYRILLFMLPGDLRRAHGRSMQAAFEDLLRESVEREGRRSVPRVWAEALMDIASESLRRRRVRRSEVPRKRVRLMEQLIQDIRYTIRSLSRSPLFTVIVVVTLALGIGASTAIFSVINSVLLRPLPYNEPDQLLWIGSALQRNGQIVGWRTVSVPDFEDLDENVTSLDLAAIEPTSLVLLGDQGPVRVRAARATSGLFPVFGADVVLGRTFLPEEYAAGADSVILLQHRLWRSRWGADPGVVGKTLQTDAGALRVVSVLAADFEPPAALDLEGTDMWRPLAVVPETADTCRTCYGLSVAGRLRDGFGLEAAHQELVAYGTALAQEYPEAKIRDDTTLVFGAMPLLESTVGSRSRELTVLFGASGLLLLIGCANVANLLLSRSNGRTAELALRSALGAGRRRLVRQLLTESLALSIVGGVVGAGFAIFAVAAFRTLGPSDYPRMATVHVHPGALGFAGLVAVITGVVFGLMPAVVSSRADVAKALREGSSKSTPGSHRSRVRSGLVCAEVAMAVVLLAGAGLLVNSYSRLAGVDPGFVPDRLLMVDIGLGDTFETESQRVDLLAALVSRVGRIPGVEAVSAVSDPPIGYVAWSPRVLREGADENDPPAYHGNMVETGYFGTMGMRLLVGRSFDGDDTAAVPLVAVVNESMARSRWPDVEPIGQRFKISRAESPWFTVVGVVNDVHQGRLDSPAAASFFVAYPQVPWADWMTLVARTSPDITAIEPALREALRDVNPNIPFDGVGRFDERVSASLQAPRFRSLLLGCFAVVALILAVGGLYGSTMYSVGKRTHEVGIRIALGAREGEVVGLLLRQGLGTTIVGVLLGLAIAYPASRVVASYLYGVSPGDPVTLAAVGSLLILASAVACWIPARRAARTDPLSALRSG